MSYFSDFVRTLSPLDRQAIQQELKLSATEQRVLEAHLQAIESKDDISALAQRLDMSISHMDKCVSQMLTKCYDFIQARQGESIFHILAKSGLHENYVHELLKRDRMYTQLEQVAEREALYHTAVNTYLLFEARLFKEKTWEKIGRRYCEIAFNPEAETLVRIRSLIRIVVIHFIKGEREVVMLEHERELLSIWAEIESKPWYESHIVLCRALAQLYTSTMNLSKVVEWWERALGILEAHPDIYPEAKYIVRGTLADAYLKLEGADAALAHCEAVWKENPGIYQRNGQLNLIYFRILLITANYARAEEVLSLRFGTMSILGTSILRPMDAVDFSMYYLYTAHYDVAKKFISEGLSLSVKVYRGVEAELRFLECAAFYLSGDLFYAQELLSRALRYFATKKEIRDAELWRQELRQMRCLLQSHEAGKDLSAKDRLYFEQLSTNSIDVFSNVLRLCWQHWQGAQNASKSTVEQPSAARRRA